MRVGDWVRLCRRLRARISLGVCMDVVREDGQKEKCLQEMEQVLITRILGLRYFSMRSWINPRLSSSSAQFVIMSLKRQGSLSILYQFPQTFLWQCLLGRLSAAIYSRRGLRAAGGGNPSARLSSEYGRGCVDYGDVSHPHRRDAARRRCGRRSPRGQRRQHDPRLAALPMRMSGDRSLSSLTDDGGVGRRRGGTRNRTSPSGLSVVGRRRRKRTRKKSR